MTRVASFADAIVFCWSGRSMRRPIIAPTFSGLAAVSAPDEPTLTAMTMSAPIASTVCTGRFSDSPPSMSMWPSISTGVNPAGMAMLARMTRARFPLDIT